MILLESSLHKQFVEEITDALSNKEYRNLTYFLDTTSVADGFLATLDSRISSQFWGLDVSTSLNNWFLNIPNWLNKILDPRTQPDESSSVLYYLWEHFSTHLISSLRMARLRSGIPPRGGVLAFVGGGYICLILKYEFTGNQPRVHPVTMISNPQSVFDFWGAIDSVSGSARNQLKQILASGHKLISHRGTLIHVDRRKDMDVFGPSIDTLVLAEVLAQAIYESNDNSRIKVAMEIGCGNGLLTVSLFKHLADLVELFSIDSDLNAVACTARNLDSVKPTKGLIHHPNIYLINGTFNPDVLNRKFDLIVCNPPYIPFPLNHLNNDLKTGDYIKAVGGTDLCELVVKSSYSLLNPGGRLLIMTSSLVLDEVTSWIPNTCNLQFALGNEGFEVLFDVEAVLSQPNWLEYLVEERGLIMKKKEMYYHTLHPLWIISTAKLYEQDSAEFQGN